MILIMVTIVNAVVIMQHQPQSFAARDMLLAYSASLLQSSLACLYYAQPDVHAHCTTITACQLSWIDALFPLRGFSA